jgi:hypothetical protein
MEVVQLDEPYCTDEDLDRLEVMVAHRLFEEGYQAHKTGVLLKDYPRLWHKKWVYWWRSGWRTCRRDEKVKR